MFRLGGARVQCGSSLDRRVWMHDYPRFNLWFWCDGETWMNLGFGRHGTARADPGAIAVAASRRRSAICHRPADEAYDLQVNRSDEERDV